MTPDMRTPRRRAARRQAWLGATVGCLYALAACGGSEARHTPSETDERLSEAERGSPAWAVAGLEVAPDLEATLFASEPMLVSPSNMDVDAHGRVWVIEVVNYRSGRNPSNPTREAGDRILILEDTTGDGTADRQTVFYQGSDINAALGIAVLGNRVIVSSSPQVLVFTDDNGDGTADRKEVLFSGIGGEDHDHGVHAIVFGPDGKYYFNFGDNGRQLRDRDGRPVIDRAGRRVEEGETYRKGMVFRSEPDGSHVEVVAHNFRNSYEVAVDSFGTLWQSDNDDDGNRAVRINYVMEYGNFGYVDETTGAGWRAQRRNREADVPSQHWHQNDPGVVPNLLHTGAGSPTGILVYEGRLLPERFRDQLVHADAGPNVVRAYPVEPAGAGYTASIVDIVRGRDQRFRPSDVTVAPDGSLFVADWHDPVVGGHVQADQEGRGRIVRVAPPGTPYRVPPLDLSTARAAAVALTSPNLATRALAWTRLHDLQDAAEPALLELWRSSNPRLRGRALWLLTKIDGRGDAYVRQALDDDDPDIRFTGLCALRKRAIDRLPYLERVVRDPSPGVRREVALALRHERGAGADALWAELALQHDGQDRWYLEALGIGADDQWDRFFDAWIARVGDAWNDTAGRDIVWRARAAGALPRLRALIADPSTRGADRLRYVRAFDFYDGPARDAALLELLDVRHPEAAEIRALALAHLTTDEARADPAVCATLGGTLAAIRGTDLFVELVDRFDLRDQNDALMDIVRSPPDHPVALEAVRLLVRRDAHGAIARALAEGDDGERAALVATIGQVDDAGLHDLLEDLVLAPQTEAGLQRAAVEGLGRGRDGERRLLGLLEAGRLPDALVPSAAAVLLRATRASIRDAAAEHLRGSGASPAADRPAIADLVARDGDSASGRAVFDRVCQACHTVGGRGIAFGPDLSAIGAKLPKEALYLSILDVDAGIAYGYEGREVRLRDGRQRVGFVVSQTADALELRLPGGATERYEAPAIASMTALEASLMPPGLDRAMSEQELIDLVEYLAGLRDDEP